MIQKIIVTTIVILAGGYVLYWISKHGGTGIGCSGCAGCKLKDGCDIPEDKRSECPEQKTHSQE